MAAAGPLHRGHHPPAGAGDQGGAAGAAMACAISTVPRSTPPVSRRGRTCSTTVPGGKEAIAGLWHDGAARETHAEEGSLDRGDGVTLAWARTPARGAGARGPCGVPAGLPQRHDGREGAGGAAFCAAHGLACLRLDYSGHGASGGAFTGGTIGRWTEDALRVVDALTDGPLVLVGAHGRLDRAAAGPGPARRASQALVGIAAAPGLHRGL